MLGFTILFRRSLGLCRVGAINTKRKLNVRNVYALPERKMRPVSFLFFSRKINNGIEHE